MNRFSLIAKQKTFIALLLVTFLAGFLRFYRLSDVPVSLYWDEVATGYNAYTIQANLHDEYGNFLPLLFRSYNDYKMPLNVYLTSISVKAFGLNEFAVRFPSAALGTLTVLVTYFLVRKLISLNDKKNPHIYLRQVPLLSAFLLSISPWHIQFSRGGFEANVALFFVVLGVYTFFAGLKKYRFLLISLIFFALALYGYRSVDVFLPIFLIGVFVIWRNELLKIGIAKLLFGVLLLILVSAPIYSLLLKQGSSRYQQTSITNQVNEEALKDFQNGKIDNRKQLYGKVFLSNYLSEFTPQFLFLSGDPNSRHGPRGMGLLYLWEIPFLLFGFYVLVKKMGNKIIGTVSIWIFAFPVAAALSIPAPHALRSLNVLPVPQLIVSLGIVYMLSVLPRKVVKLFVGILSLVVVLFFFQYVSLYNATNTTLAVSDWGDGYKQLVSYVVSIQQNYDRIIVSGHYWQPYMYFLFFTKYNPVLYQKYGDSAHFGKYIFGGTSWDLAVGRPELGGVNLKNLTKSNKVLVALSPDEYNAQSMNIEKTYEIKNHNGQTVFILGNLK